MNFFQEDKAKKLKYAQTLKIIAALSNLFSDNSKPFIYYRIMENLFCECFGAENLSRSDTAYDAKIGTLGIGLKTFLCEKHSIEKVAEFNKKSKDLKDKKNLELAYELGTLRNERIDLANNTYGINKALYHIIARQDNKLVFFETDYDKIDISKIRILKDNKTSLSFDDGINEYVYNHSKSVLQRKFILPKEYDFLDIKILDNPFEIIRSLENKIDNLNLANTKAQGIDYVYLPLYAKDKKTKEKYVPELSQLNQWNGNGRNRKYGETYIPIPAEFYKVSPNFFPSKDEPFTLITPLGEKLNAKLCQGSPDKPKALMTNPNNALTNWILKQVLGLKDFELLNIDKLERLNIDSVKVEKTAEKVYKIDIASWDSYENFIKNSCFSV